jgi:serine phosphatase RsbU (regulator of sigma subunit)
MNDRDLFSDSVVTFKSIVLFTVLTILNVSVFVFMVFENQMDLIAKNAELESKDKGVMLKIKVEEIIAGRGGTSGRRCYDVTVGAALLFQNSDTASVVLDTLREGETVLSDYEVPGWHRVLSRDDAIGWVRDADVSDHVPARERGELNTEDIRLILAALDEEGLQDYSIFLEDGYILADSRSRGGDDASEDEKMSIKKAVFKNSFENLAFYHEVNRRSRTVDLYIPVYFGLNKLVVLKPTIPMQYVWMQTRFLYSQCVIMGVLVLVVHVLFVIVNQRAIIRPMVRERTTVLERKNRQIQEAKDALQGAYDQLATAHGHIENELNTARAIQMAMIPKGFPDLPGYTLYARYLPAAKVGGDFYDFYRIDSEHVGIIIADASGHGIPAAFLVSMAKMSFRAHAPGEMSSSKMLEGANSELVGVLVESHYLTACYIVLHIPTGRITFTRASHPSPIHYRARDGSLEHLESNGIFVGMLEDGRYDDGRGVLEPGDRLVLHTDGISEAADPHEKRYGKERIDAVVKQHGHSSPEQIGLAVMKDVGHFAQGQQFEDDVTLLVLGRE